MEQRHPHWRVHVLPSADRPLAGLAVTGLVAEDNLLLGVRQYVNTHPDTLHVVLVLDQFEEVFTQCAADERTLFIEQLQAVLESDLPISIVLVMRNDFYSQLNRVAPALMHYVAANQIHLPDTLTYAALEAIITKPAHASGASLEAGLVERIITDLIQARPVEQTQAGAALPLLAFTLTRLWEESDGRCLTHAAYTAIGGIQGALVTWGTTTLAHVPTAQHLLLNRLLLELVQPGDGRESIPDSRRRQTLDALRATLGDDTAFMPLIRHLAAARLLVTGRDGMHETVELTHDALVREWDYLRELVAHNRRFLAWKRVNETHMAYWHAAGRNAARLLPAEELPTARRWRSERGGDLGAALLDYLEQSEVYWRRRRRLRVGALWSFVGGICLLTLILSYAYIQVNSNLRRSEAERMQGQRI
jgi:hypothetical protein